MLRGTQKIRTKTKCLTGPPPSLECNDTDHRPSCVLLAAKITSMAQTSISRASDKQPSAAHKPSIYVGYTEAWMAVNSDKKFYLETFGCQMNVHDSEKVIGTLISEGYRQVPTVEEADLILYNTCSIRDKAEQKVFHRLADYKRL